MAIYKVIGKGQDGKYMDDMARIDVSKYCMRDDKTPSHFIGGRAVNPANAAEEMRILAQVYNNDTGVRLRHSVISFSPQEDITMEQAAQIADAAIRYFGDEHQIFYSVHEDADHIHAHIVMNQVSYIDGHKYRGTKKELYDFLHYMNQVLQPYGTYLTYVSE